MQDGVIPHEKDMRQHREEIHSCPELMAYIQEVGFLPLLYSGIAGFSAEEVVDDDNRYVVLPDGGWDWPLWKWKGPIVQEGICVYGKFFAGKAGFISREWWPDFCNYRRSKHPQPEEGSVEEAILLTLQEHGSLRSRFDAYVTKLQMACRITTEDFVYPRDKHNNEYGWGWALLTTPEQQLGKDAMKCERTPEESYQRILAHFHKILPEADNKQIERLLCGK